MKAKKTISLILSVMMVILLLPATPVNAKVKLSATSKTPVPLASNWYSQNEQRIWEACKTCDISKKELFHRILYYLGETYDLDAAKQIYKKERGYAPKYAMDIVGYFPELREMADEFIDRVLYSEFF